MCYRSCKKNSLHWEKRGGWGELKSRKNVSSSARVRSRRSAPSPCSSCSSSSSDWLGARILASDWLILAILTSDWSGYYPGKFSERMEAASPSLSSVSTDSLLPARTAYIRAVILWAPVSCWKQADLIKVHRHDRRVKESILKRLHVCLSVWKPHVSHIWCQTILSALSVTQD